MGAFDRARRASVSFALLLLLAVAGSGVADQRAAGGGTASATAGEADVQPSQPPASVSLREAAAPTPRTPRPPVRVGAVDAVARPVRGTDVPDVLLRAYRAAVADAPASCHLQVSLLAAIGEVETGSLSGRPLDRRHRTSVLGPVLDGHGFAAVRDTDHGAWDGNRTWDRAVGPMQFLPGTWRAYGTDGDGDGVADPQDVEDAAASAAAFLCYSGRDLASPATLRTAVLAYNHSTAYLDLVSTYQQRYARLGLDRGLAVTGAVLHLQAIEATDLTRSPAPATRLSASRPAPTARVTVTRRPAATSPAAPTRSPATTAAPTSASTGTPAAPASGSPTPAATATSTATSTGTSTAEPTPSPTGHPTATATPTGRPTGSPSAHPSPTPSPTPSPKPTTTPTTTPSPTPTATPTAPSPTGAPVACPAVPSGDGTVPAADPTGGPTAGPTAVATSAATPAPPGTVPVAGSTGGLVCPPCGPTATSTPAPSPTATPSLGADGTISCVPVTPPAASPSSGQ